MNSRCNKPIESLQGVCSKNLLSTNAQLDSVEEILVHWETKEKPIDSVLTNPSKVTKAPIETIEVNGFTLVQETL